MARPYSSPGKKTLLSAIFGTPIEGNTPRWMDRQHGYVPKIARGGNTKRRSKPKR